MAKDIGKTRLLQYPMLPIAKLHEVGNPKQLRIAPKENGEIRILSVDVAVMGPVRCKCQAKNPLSIRKQKSPKQKTEKSKGLLKTMQNSRPPLLEAGGIFN